MAASGQLSLPNLNTNHRNLLRRAIMQEKKEPGSYFTVGKAVSNRNDAVSKALAKIEGLGLVEIVRSEKKVNTWQVRLIVCPIELGELLS